jgi:hypothetical protein
MQQRASRAHNPYGDGSAVRRGQTCKKTAKQGQFVLPRQHVMLSE